MVLQAIRERLSGIIAIFIFALLIIPFAFVGVNSYWQSDTVNSVAVVNDVEISAAQFAEGFQNYRRRMQMLLGESFDPEQFDQPTVRRAFLDEMINREVLTQASVEAGLEVNDETLAQAIREQEAFQVDGEFNADVYQSRLMSQGTTPQQYENEMRAQLILDQFPGTIQTSAIATNRELEEYVRLQDEKRSFRAVLVPAQAEPETPAGPEGSVEQPPAADPEVDSAKAEEEVAEADIAAWYEGHAQDYRSEEQVVIEYVELDAATMGEDLAIDEDQLRSRFEEQRARFITPETRLASHILIEVSPEADEATQQTARQQAEDLAQRARAGEDFATLAREHSQDAGSASLGGDLGWIEPGFMVQAFEEGLYALALEKPISDPVQTGFGWHVIQLRDVRPAEGMSFEEARAILQEEFLTEERERIFLEQADRLVDLVYEDPTTLSASAEILGLEVLTAGPFGRAGGEGIAGNPAVVSAAFSELSLQQGSVSDPVDLGENHIVMLRVKEHFPEALRPLDEVRAQVADAVRADRRKTAAAALAGELLAKLDAGQELAALAEEHGLQLLEQESAGRTSTDVAADLLQQVFQMKSPEGDGPATATVPLENGYAVVLLQSITPGAITADDALRGQNYRRRIANARASAEAYGFIRMLRSQSQVEVFEDRL